MDAETSRDLALADEVNRRLTLLGLEDRIEVCGYGSRGFADLGRFYAVNVVTSHITAKHVDPRAWLSDLT